MPLLPGLTLRTRRRANAMPAPTPPWAPCPRPEEQGIGLLALLLAMADSARAEAGFVCGAVFEKELRDIYPRYVPMETMGRIRNGL